MKISIIGCGHVGMVTDVCFVNFGHDITFYDVNRKKLDLQARQHADGVVGMPARPLGSSFINVSLSHWDNRPHAIFEQPLYLECDKVW